MLSFILAFLAVQLCVQPVAALYDKWKLNDLTTHFMGEYTGLPDPTWPEPAKFNSSISFTVDHFTGPLHRYDLAQNILASCDANWTKGAVPTEWMPCQVQNNVEKMTWRFAPGSFRSESDFKIEVLGIRIVVFASYMQRDSIVIATGSLQVTANEPTVSSSYLTCLTGAPLAGIVCNTNGNLSSQTTPIQMEAGDDASNTRTIPAFDVRWILANPYASSNHETCMKQVQMEITQQRPTLCFVQWQCQAGEPNVDNQYQCNNDPVDNTISFSMKPEPTRSVFDGFVLGLKRAYSVTVQDITLNIQMDVTKPLRLDEELVRDCGPSGHDRCIIKAKKGFEVRPVPAEIEISY